MTILIRSAAPIARKNYHCDACEYVRESVNEGIFSLSEYRQVVKAKRQGWKIRVGQKYKKEIQINQGDFVVYRAIPEMDELCRKYDLWPDW